LMDEAKSLSATERLNPERFILRRFNDCAHLRSSR
jgi:hypothetical protein